MKTNNSNMKKTNPINKVVLILILLYGTNLSVFAQQSDELKSTEDLSFLVGKWEIVRIYNPGSGNERVLNGTLICKESLDDQFIKCTYEIKRPGKIRGLDVVYYNYNSIYELYESMWLSSTWPIKGLFQGTLQKNKNLVIFSTSGQFEIDNNVTEFVKGQLIVQGKDLNFNSFTRNTHIRTTNFEEGVWNHHMTETAKRINK
jgi:hypothetical protein